jgi:hypothetical protein
MIISRWILLRKRNISDKRRTENQNTHFMFNNVFIRKSCCLRNNVEKCCAAGEATDDNITRGTRFACWISMATHTYSKCVILITFPRQQWYRESASLLCYTYTACFDNNTYFHARRSANFLSPLRRNPRLFYLIWTLHLDIPFTAHAKINFVLIAVAESVKWEHVKFVSTGMKFKIAQGAKFRNWNRQSVNEMQLNEWHNKTSKY